ncbi:hypothetical protein ERO13_A12G018600v2 [Gossypium hirsutum]|uniref:Phytosulfokine n=6 Tax=Gossypium TaxID=3633 RepID=A0A2P5YXA8_GOSBA|nr:phytosulfokines-like [Gossypium arboreum]XP_040938403.1 phytosulfokines-like [Gossypium hirsutum]KAB2050897.1 hypothetical protein ES319_A12G018400v1 [Gossypium barbadense]TYG88408.1 hypothetical protein ES288_A12G018900v1 [Gossypium darwinii]TYH94126.1 hypothetical protein ES332_A12G019600v1 [Gossypium tomentosum]TYJ03319.1 hypothetical protein E1A91_A12G019500v1 [Gossypium mustelinum]KAG4168370.1 hypothetical protein ERO13_A12G018600v2 [Gossypium hirsutum]
MSCKVSAFCMILFLLFFTLSSAAAAARPLQHPNPNTPIQTQNPDTETKRGDVDDDICRGIKEEGEECLMRRTLAAHVDYIYTQKANP